MVYFQVIAQMLLRGTNEGCGFSLLIAQLWTPAISQPSPPLQTFDQNCIPTFSQKSFLEHTFRAIKSNANQFNKENQRQNSMSSISGECMPLWDDDAECGAWCKNCQYLWSARHSKPFPCSLSARCVPNCGVLHPLIEIHGFADGITNNCCSYFFLNHVSDSIAVSIFVYIFFCLTNSE